MEDNFEKKSHKKVGIIIGVIVAILVIAVAGGAVFLGISRKPEKIFSKAIEDGFKTLEKDAKQDKVKMDLECSLNLKSNNSEIASANEIIKDVKLTSTIETDINKKIFDISLGAKYGKQDIINIDTLIQNDEMFFYLDDIYSKMIKVTDEDLEDENLEGLFDVDTEQSEKFIKNIEQLLLDEIEEKELTQETVKVDNEKMLKSTIRLTPKEVLELTKNILEEYEKVYSVENIDDIIEDLEDTIEDLDETDNYLDISIYTKGIFNEFVKVEAALVNQEDDTVIVLEGIKKSDSETEINLLENEESTDLSDVTNLISITVKKEDENKGTIQVKINVDDGETYKLKIKYSVDYDAKIKERDTSNSVDLNNLTQEDYLEMYENIENNEILYSIIDLISQPSYPTPDYDEDYDYEDLYRDYLDDDYSDWDYNYDYSDYDYDTSIDDSAGAINGSNYFGF